MEFYKDKGDFSDEIPASLSEYRKLCPEDQAKVQLKTMWRKDVAFEPLSAIRKKYGLNSLRCQYEDEGNGVLLYHCGYAGNFRVVYETLDVQKVD